MPIYEVQVKDGTTYEVDVPNEAALKVAASRIQTMHATQRARKAYQETQAAYDAGEAIPANVGGRVAGMSPDQNKAAWNPADSGGQDMFGNSTSPGAERVWAGAGKFFSDIGTGARQIAGSVADAILPQEPTMAGLITGQQPSRAQEMAQQVDAQRRLDAPLMDTLGGQAGYLGAGLATALIPGSATVRGAALTGGVLGAAQPVGTGDSRLTNTAVGAGLGAVGAVAANKVGNAAQRWRTARAAAATSGASATTSGASSAAQAAIQATAKGGGAVLNSVDEAHTSGLNATQARLAERGRELGFRMTPGQVTGNKGLLQREAQAESNPAWSAPFWRVKDANQTQLNRYAAQAIGESSDVIDDKVLSAARSRIGKVYDAVADDRPRNVPANDVLAKLTQVEQEYSPIMMRPGGLAEHPLVARFVEQVGNGPMTGRQLQNLSRHLGGQARAQMSNQAGDRELGHALLEVKGIVDDMLAEGLSGDMAQAFTNARQQYRVLATLENTAGAVKQDGNVSGLVLGNALGRTDKAGFLRGGNNSPFYDALRFTQSFRSLVGDSGTATRAAGVAPTVLGVAGNVAAKGYVSPASVNAFAKAQRAGMAVSPGLEAVLPVLLPGIRGGSNALVPYLSQQ